MHRIIPGSLLPREQKGTSAGRRSHQGAERNTGEAPSLGLLEVLQGTEAEEVSMESQAGVSSILPDEPEPEASCKTEAAEAHQTAVICAAAAEYGLVSRFCK